MQAALKRARSGHLTPQNARAGHITPRMNHTALEVGHGAPDDLRGRGRPRHPAPFRHTVGFPSEQAC